MQDNQKNLSKRITIRLTETEWKLLQEYIYLSQTSMSKYERKRLYGGRPVVPKTDMLMINELRRIGGLLKHNFTTMREANVPKELLEMQEKACKKGYLFNLPFKHICGIILSGASNTFIPSGPWSYHGVAFFALSPGSDP